MTDDPRKDPLYLAVQALGEQAEALIEGRRYFLFVVNERAESPDFVRTNLSPQELRDAVAKLLLDLAGGEDPAMREFVAAQGRPS